MEAEIGAILTIISASLALTLFTLRISIKNQSCISRIESTLNLEARLSDIEDRIVNISDGK